jgi:hypothetical protein
MKEVLQFTDDEKGAKAEIEKYGGRILHQFSSSAFVAQLPENVKAKALRKSTGSPPPNLDEITQLAVKAWLADENKLDRPPTLQEGLSWATDEDISFEDHEDFIDGKHHNSVNGGRSFTSTGTETSLYLTGPVAVGVILVSRDQGREQLKPDEEEKIIQEAQIAFHWLATMEPLAKVSFVYDIHRIPVTAAPGPYEGIEDAYEKYEQQWRDEALGKMSYNGGRTGYQKYVNDLKIKKGTNWAYVVFFNKYKLNRHAYTIWEKTVINYDNDGFGPENLHRTFAHESCHIFGASDEYRGCGCNKVSGYLDIPNKNCANCFSPDEHQAECLMNKNTLVMCEWSRKQIGWDERLFPA